MVNTLSSLETIKEIDEKDEVRQYFNEASVNIDIRTLAGGVKTLVFANKISIQDERGYLVLDKQQDDIFLIAEKDMETISAAFGQANIFK